MKQMTKKHDGKVTELTGKIRSLQNEIARLNKANAILFLFAMWTF